MKTTSLGFTTILLIILVSGCSHKEIKPKIEYVYKTKIEYVYLPCENKLPLNKDTSTKKNKLLEKDTPKSLVKKSSEKQQKKYKEPKKTKIYAPRKYIKRPNKNMDFMVGINKDGSEFIYMEGEFGINTYKNFIKFLKQVNTNAKEIKISSNGGTVSTAMQIGSYIHENRWNTGVDKEMHCFSACGFVYFAGKEKSLEGKALVGLHRPYIPGNKDTTKSINKIKRDYISYWNYIRAPKSLYDEMMEVGREDLFILNRKNINDYIEVEIK